MQLIIAIIFVFALVGLGIRPSNREREKRDHSLVLSTALVEFHKYQCYFMFAIEIAALVLVSQVYQASSQYRTPLEFDLLLSIPLSMNGLVPIIFTLCCISRYGRLSWHIIILSSVTVALSTASLAAACKWIRITGEAHQEMLDVNYDSGMNLAKIVCGSASSNLENIIDRTAISFSLIWAIYAYCVSWGLWCLIKHTLDRFPGGAHQHRLLKAVQNLVRSPSFNKLPRSLLSRVGYVLFIFMWALCFAYHFYLYSLFTRFAMVSRVWSFGQIIAVSAWVPTIVEYCYMEYGELV